MSGGNAVPGRNAAAALLSAPWALAILVVWVLLNYAWTLPFAFVNDDWMWVYDVSHLRDRPQEYVVSYHFSRNFFRPLIQLTFALNHLAGGIDPRGYRLVNVLGHVGVTILVWRLALVARLRPAAALVAAMAFAVQPTRPDSVVWVSGRTEVLCALFFIAAALAEIRRRTAWGLLLFGAALVCKETAVCLPLVILLGETLLRPPQERHYRRVLPYLALLAGYAVIRWLTVPTFASDIMGVQATGAPPMTLAEVAAVFRGKITLLGEFVLSPLPVHGFWRSVVLLLGGGAVALWGTRPGPDRTAARYGAGWAVITLLPYSGWVMFQRWYVYFAVVGTCLAAAAIGADLISRLGSPGLRRAAAVLAAGLWLSVSAADLWSYNDRERRGGVLTEEVEDALAAAARPSPPRTLFVAAGLGRFVLGADPLLDGRPILIFGLTEAVRLRVRDEFLDVEFGNLEMARRRSATRPVVLLEWDEHTRRFNRTWQSF